MDDRNGTRVSVPRNFPVSPKHALVRSVERTHMANLLAANVTVLDSWLTGSTSTRRNKVRRVKWTSTTAGGGTNRLLATAFGFTKILHCSSILLDASTKKVYPAVPSSN